MFDENKPARVGTGAARFFVRGGSSFSLERAAVLRPAYNEFPSSYPLDPDFPQPGRRSGSRPPPVTGEAGGEQALRRLPGGAASYPSPRPVGGRDIPTGIGNPALAVGRAGEVSSFDPCIGDGDSISIQLTVVNLTETVRVSQRISRPFVIERIQFWGTNPDSTVTTNVIIRVKVSNDNDTNGGLESSGQSIHRLGNQIPDGRDAFIGIARPQEYWPGFVVLDPPKFLKFCFKNETGGTLPASVIASIRYLR